jgi:hypothetical protein
MTQSPSIRAFLQKLGQNKGVMAASDALEIS